MVKEVNSLKEPTVICCGLVQSHKTITTKKGDRMAFVQCEDLTDSAEVIVFPSVFAKVETLLDQYNVFIIKGTLDITAQTTCKIKANELIPADTALNDPSLFKAITLKLPQEISESFLENLKATLPKGTIPLQIAFQENGNDFVLLTSNKIAFISDVFKDFSSQGIGVQINV